MPRTARKKSENGIYHIILRGINKQTIFYDDEDRKKFLYTLKKVKGKCDYNIYAYCLMSNHIHLLMKENKEPIGNIMRRLAASYVYWYNNKYERIGNLYQDRFKSEPVETDSYLLSVVRYIHQNPMKAGISKDVADYYWSSYNDYFTGGGITDIDFILNVFKQGKVSAINQFIDFNRAQNKDSCLEVNETGSKIKDKALVSLISEKFGIEAAMMKNEPRDKMKIVLREILEIEGVSTRQLARVTGISTGVIWRL